MKFLWPFVSNLYGRFGIICIQLKIYLVFSLTTETFKTDISIVFIVMFVPLSLGGALVDLSCDGVCVFLLGENTKYSLLFLKPVILNFDNRPIGV